MSIHNLSDKKIYNDNGEYQPAQNINAYLLDMPNIYVKSSSKPISNVINAREGNMPNDKGYLSHYTPKDVQDFISKYPKAKPLFKRIAGAKELIQNKKRYCLWLDHVNPNKWVRIKAVRNIVNKVKKYRLSSRRKRTRELSKVPYLFGEIRQPKTNYIAIPVNASRLRKYVPFSIVSPNIIANVKCLTVATDSRYYFGILSSIVHRLWIKITASKWGDSYQYSSRITYNTFPWPNTSINQKHIISQDAQNILDIRRHHNNTSLADLYNPLSMPPDLQEAHQANDKAVLKVYGLKSTATKNEIITKLLKMYAKLTKESK